MARETNKLKPLVVKNASAPGLYGDGGGLWLHVGKPIKNDESGKPSGKSWLFRQMIYGNAREVELRPLHTVTLAEARERARAARLLVLDKKDPLALREEE